MCSLNIGVFSSLVPVPNVTVYAPNNQIVSKSLQPECTIMTVRGITSRVDIVWRSDDVELKRIINANINLTINNSELYKDTFNISLLSTSDDGRVFQCEMIIMTTPSIVATSNITLDVTGKCTDVSYFVLRRFAVICLVSGELYSLLATHLVNQHYYPKI